MKDATSVPHTRTARPYVFDPARHFRPGAFDECARGNSSHGRVRGHYSRSERGIGRRIADRSEKSLWAAIWVFRKSQPVRLGNFCRIATAGGLARAFAPGLRFHRRNIGAGRHCRGLRQKHRAPKHRRRGAAGCSCAKTAPATAIASYCSPTARRWARAGARSASESTAYARSTREAVATSRHKRFCNGSKSDVRRMRAFEMGFDLAESGRMKRLMP